MLYIGTGKEAECVDPAVGRGVNGLRTSRNYLDCFNLSEIKVYLRIRTGRVILGAQGREGAGDG